MRDLYIKTKNGDMYYQKHLDSDDSLSIIFLHGWGQSHNTFDYVIEKIKESGIKYNIYNVDFLGFGLSDEPNKAIGVDDYSNHLHQLIKEEKIDKVILVGHSFGGRVAIKYASSFNVEGIVLVNAAGICHHNFKYYSKLYLYKIKKLMVYVFNNKNYDSFIRKNGSRDYNMLSYNMRGTFKKVVKEDLKKEMKMIKCKTLVIGSVFDKEVPLNDSKTMNNLINGSEMKVFYRGGHFSYIDEKEKFLSILLNFIGDK